MPAVIYTQSERTDIMKIEIREAEGRLHISGYVNVVERDSKPIETLRGRCVEQVRAGAFAASLSDGHEVRMMLNHNRNIGSTTNGTLTLKENNVGLYAEAWTDDSEVRELARRGELKGWSFGFKAIEDRLEERSGDIPRRYLDRLELHEVSILSVNPAYSGTLIEARSEPVETLESNAEDGDTEDKSGDETRSDGTAADQSAEDEAELEFRAQKTAELKAFVDEYRRQKTLELYCYLKTLEFREYMRELRYNHYHNPQNGQFASGKGGGEGLIYSFGKGKGSEIVGASSTWNVKANYGKKGTGFEVNINGKNKAYQINNSGVITGLGGNTETNQNPYNKAISTGKITHRELVEKVVQNGGKFISEKEVERITEETLIKKALKPDYEMGNAFGEHGWGAKASKNVYRPKQLSFF